MVGYMGDGINDAPALHAADVGISVDTAVDVAKESAAIVLLDKDLRVLLDGVRQGRRTFANTMKYVFTTTSASFGNVLSMAAASAFLPFLPLLADQILLINFLTDFPATTIATDDVDEEQLDKPHSWDIGFVRNFMIVFGLVSSAFDFLTFGVLRLGFNADADHVPQRLVPRIGGHRARWCCSCCARGGRSSAAALFFFLPPSASHPPYPFPPFRPLVPSSLFSAFFPFRRPPLNPLQREPIAPKGASCRPFLFPEFQPLIKPRCLSNPLSRG